MHKELIEQLETLLAELNDHQEAIETWATMHRFKPTRMRNKDGSWALTPVLLAKSNALLALAQLKNDYGRIW